MVLGKVLQLPQHPHLRVIGGIPRVSVVPLPVRPGQEHIAHAVLRGKHVVVALQLGLVVDGLEGDAKILLHIGADLLPGVLGGQELSQVRLGPQPAQHQKQRRRQHKAQHGPQFLFSGDRSAAGPLFRGAQLHHLPEHPAHKPHTQNAQRDGQPQPPVVTHIGEGEKEQQPEQQQIPFSVGAPPEGHPNQRNGGGSHQQRDPQQSASPKKYQGQRGQKDAGDTHPQLMQPLLPLLLLLRPPGGQEHLIQGMQLGHGHPLVKAVGQKQGQPDLPGQVSGADEVLQAKDQVQLPLGPPEQGAGEELFPLPQGGLGVVEHLQGVKNGLGALPARLLA